MPEPTRSEKTPNGPPPTVSVILPTHNRAALLRRSMGSVLQQSFRDLELIVVDDGSTEDVHTASLAFGDPRVVYIRRERRGGVAAARNTGIRVARGSYVAFQDSDDEWLLDKLQLQVRALDEAPGCSMVICGLLRYGSGAVRRYPPMRTEPTGDLSYDAVVQLPFAYTQSWLVRRDALLAENGFDETLRVWDDWELLMRLASRVRIRLLPEPLVISERSADSISNENERFMTDMRRIIDKHWDRLAATPCALAHLEYVYARLLGTSDRTREARQALIRSLRRRPCAARPWALLAASLMGPAALRALLRLPPRRS